MKQYNTSVAVVGCGNMGKNHARVFNDIGCLKAVVEPNFDKRKSLKNLYPNVDIVDSIDLADADAYVIATPTTQHYDLAKKLISLEKHVLIEKPVCKTVKQASELLKLANSQPNCIVAVGHVERFNPVVDYLREWLEKRDLKTIETQRLSSLPKRIKDIGVFQDLGIHDIDVVLSLVNSPVKSVYALSSIKDSQDLYTKASIKFENGTCAFITTSWLSSSKIRKIRVSTDLEDAEMDYLKQTFETKKINLSLGNNHFQPQTYHQIERVELKKEEPLMRQALDFLDSIENNTHPKVSLEQGFEALKIVDLVLKSANEERSINL